MDQVRMDAEGGRVIYRGKRARKLAVVVAVQNLLVVSCLLATLYVYRELHSWLSGDIVHIHLDGIAMLRGNVTLKFEYIGTNYKMEMNENKDKFFIQCTGPYIWYMDVCYIKTKPGANNGTLLLRVEGNEIPVSSIELNTTHEVCRGLYSTVYLRAQEVASLHLISPANFMISNVTIGLSYLLGKRCEI